MTLYEHAMLGATGALAAGLHRRCGWQIVAMAGCVAAVPDWDGALLFVDRQGFASIHRIWGHNLLVAGLVGLALGLLARGLDLFTRIRRALAARWKAVRPQDSAELDRGARGPWWMWGLVGVLAAYSHLAADLFFSYGKDLPVWELQLLWPFSTRGWAIPAVPWGDPVAAILFAGAMFAMVRWPARIQAVSLAALGLVAAYATFRAL
jgi:membrane-bound metal-dependent hydrolase YbcI (DUF457 family)